MSSEGRRTGLGWPQSTDAATLERHFGSTENLLPLWIAEPSVDLAPAVRAALSGRAESGWYGYEVRPESIIDAFWAWMVDRHAWDGSDLRTLVSPSVGTSIGVLIEQFTSPGDGVIIQPPVFTDFKTLISSAGRAVVKNSLVLSENGYRIDFDDLAAKAADPNNRMLILCSPHNPVGRVWRSEELSRVASICGENDVFVLADEIHADITIPPNVFHPFATSSAGHEVAWAASHGPIKTFGLAGVCDTLLVTNNDEVAATFERRSSQLHLTRNNVFGLAAFEAAYREGAGWLDTFLALIETNMTMLQDDLPSEVSVSPLEGTYLAWLDLQRLGLGVPEIPTWLGSKAGLALSPGHWFGREGAGYARMTVAVPSEVIEQAVANLRTAISS